MLRRAFFELLKDKQLTCWGKNGAVVRRIAISNIHTECRRRQDERMTAYDQYDVNPRILITGALGQLGYGMAKLFREKYGKENVFMSDIRKPPKAITDLGPYIFADILDYSCLQKIVVTQRIDWVVHFSALLSAVAEENMDLSMKVNVGGTQNVIQLAHQYDLRVFIPSSIATFGLEAPRNPTPNVTVQRPSTIYGVAKVYTELLGEYYFQKFGTDFRCLRLPGILSSDTSPGGGTTDYAIEIFHDALKTGKHSCFLGPNTRLPMMHIDDCLRSILQIMEMPSQELPARIYNVAGDSFTPSELAAEIKKELPSFEIEYKPDHRQKIADTWPQVLDDSSAQNDWGWRAQYDTKAMVKSMLNDLRPQYDSDYQPCADSDEIKLAASA